MAEDGRPARRRTKRQRTLIESLRKTPIVQLACDRAKVSRATFYRWINDDPAFAAEVEAARAEGDDLVSDAAESQLIQNIRAGNTRSITYWLGHRSLRWRPEPDIPLLPHDPKLATMTPEEKQQFAVAQLLSLIGKENLPAIRFFLQHTNDEYAVVPIKQLRSERRAKEQSDELDEAVYKQVMNDMVDLGIIKPDLTNPNQLKLDLPDA